MSLIDELYLARMEAESVEQDLWERLRLDPSDIQLQNAHTEAAQRAEAAGVAYLDALVEAEAKTRRARLMAV